MSRGLIMNNIVFNASLHKDIAKHLLWMNHDRTHFNARIEIVMTFRASTGKIVPVKKSFKVPMMSSHIDIMSEIRRHILETYYREKG
jgi:hypothetical protein